MPIPESSTSIRSPSGSSQRPRTETPPSDVNFTAFPARLRTICRSRRGSAFTNGGTESSTCGVERQVLILHAGPQDVLDVVDDGADVARHGDHRHHAGLDLREIQDVVQDAEKRLSRLLDRLDAAALLVVETALQYELRHAEDARERRTDLVAHVRQEEALGRIGSLGARQRGVKPLLDVPALEERGDVVDRLPAVVLGGGGRAPAPRSRAGDAAAP